MARATVESILVVDIGSAVVEPARLATGDIEARTRLIDKSWTMDLTALSSVLFIYYCS
jgi:hypothetical protein